MGWMGNLFGRGKGKYVEANAYTENDLRVASVDNPLDVREDGSIHPGDPAYDFMMEIMNSENGIGSAVQREDGTWETKLP